jgi:hypothetical protein
LRVGIELGLTRTNSASLAVARSHSIARGIARISEDHNNAIVNSRNLTVISSSRQIHFSYTTPEHFCTDIGVCKHIFTAQNFFSQYQRSCSHTKSVFRRPLSISSSKGFLSSRKNGGLQTAADNEAGFV